MKLYLALSAASLTADEVYANLVRVAIYSARRHTSLSPVLIFDGNACAFTDEIRSLGAEIVFHGSSLGETIRRTRANDAAWQRIAHGAYLRLDIPLIETTDDTVLYTDCDVVFLREPPTLPTPKLFAAAPERHRGNDADMSSGVMLINVPAITWIVVWRATRACLEVRWGSTHGVIL